MPKPHYKPQGGANIQQGGANAPPRPPPPPPPPPQCSSDQLSMCANIARHPWALHDDTLSEKMNYKTFTPYCCLSAFPEEI